ncbi:MAG: hypothetical protein SGARI_007280 [Bacillariaceae sp.]
MEHVIVVLGAPITTEATPGPDMKERLDRCLELYNNENNTKDHPFLVVVTGGTPPTYGSSGVKPEAEVMAEYLIAHGMSSSDLILESRALHTFHNALYTRQILTNDDMGIVNNIRKVTILTHDWHMQRSLWCFELVWCDAVEENTLEFAQEAIPSDAGVVQERVTKEQKILAKGWGLQPCLPWPWQSVGLA